MKLNTKQGLPLKSYPVSARLGSKDVLESGFDLDGSPPDALTITLARSYELIGKVFDAANKPVSGALVAMLAGQVASGTLAITDADGAFHVSLLAGQHHIYVIHQQPCSGGCLHDPDYLKAHEKDFPPVLVVEGENPPLTLRLPSR
jgi:hypothetical protein